jgi:hypothetical protein
MIRYAVALAGALALGVVTLTATTVIPADFRQLVSESSTIVRGHVTDVRAIVRADHGIESIATVAVDDTLKGDAEPFVYVYVPGGTVGRSRMLVVDAPTFKAGDQAVFFLLRGSDNALRPIGLWMGVYRLQADARTGQPMIAPPLVIGQTASAGPVVRGDVRRQSMAVQEFTSLVKLVMASPKAPASAPAKPIAPGPVRSVGGSGGRR